jgi:hypothetical protein
MEFLNVLKNCSSLLENHLTELLLFNFKCKLFLYFNKRAVLKLKYLKNLN